MNGSPEESLRGPVSKKILLWRIKSRLINFRLICLSGEENGGKYPILS